MDDAELMARRFVSRSKAAKYLDVSVNTLTRMVTEGELPAVKIRGQVHFRISDLEAQAVKVPVFKDQP
ncbi:helix-turn-helix domain-containing protein [Propionibacterium freudenreichii]|uniref:helix-turn-helix domain-containing protein n=1 Tax=Propionibacterium freudenreichii TaxID=1744 RepID=UPI000542717F|nr:helix-turn-helix domain-containing protein [Propionibacterium freudenreichii]CEG99575.1 Hypothetical protein PFCIRM127_05935 [Propionibacterium freudenreichii]